MASETAAAIIYGRGPLIGTFLGLALYGVTCIQAFFYFQTYARDSCRLKMTVAFVVLFETAHAAISMWVMDDYLIAHYADLRVLESATWLSTSMFILGFLIDFYVYLYFTWRIWMFSKRAWIAILMSVLSISRTAISIVACVVSLLKPTWHVYLDSSRTLLITGNMLFIAGDTFSACAMAYHLAKFKSWVPPDFPRPRVNILLDRFLVFWVATGALTSLVDVIALVLTLSQSQSLAFLSAILVQTRLYANSLLASLNIRNAATRAYDVDPNSPIELAGVSLQFARRSQLSSDSHGCDDDGAQGRVHDTSKSGVESWNTSQVHSRTFPQV